MPCVVASIAAVATEIFQNHDLIFSSRPTTTTSTVSLQWQVVEHLTLWTFLASRAENWCERIHFPMAPRFTKILGQRKLGTWWSKLWYSWTIQARETRWMWQTGRMGWLPTSWLKCSWRRGNETLCKFYVNHNIQLIWLIFDSHHNFKTRWVGSLT